MRRRWPLLLACVLATGCASTEGDGLVCDADAPPSTTASCVLWFWPGPGAGHGQSRFPDVVYGGPTGVDAHHQSLDVLSLGRGGEIAIGFGGGGIVDGDGPDFVVFENAFLVGTSDDPAVVFKELGEVSVSEDGSTWTTFPCASDAYPYTGCAGWRPVLANADNGIPATDPRAGGDPFDLRDVGLASARYVKIRDISNYGAADDAGFDLDAVAVIHPPPP
jgi:hypothetical protein